MNRQSIGRFIKLVFLAGGIIDAAALIPMVSPGAARIFWGFTDLPDVYWFGMLLAAVFMLAWTLLLFWAWRKPFELIYVAPLTVIIVAVFFALEIWAVSVGLMPFAKALPSMILQPIFMVLFSLSYVLGRKVKKAGESS